MAHLHYVLFGGAIFGLFSGIYYWFPKVTGRLMDDKVGKWNFWLMFIGMNMTFAPMHQLGLNGMVRRTYRYPEGLGLDMWNMIATIGAFVLALGVFVFLVNLVRSYRGGDIAGNDPWDARTLEWTTSSPPPVHNFDQVPVVQGRGRLLASEVRDGQPGPVGPNRVVRRGSRGAGRRGHPPAVSVVFPDPGCVRPVRGGDGRHLRAMGAASPSVSA